MEEILKPFSLGRIVDALNLRQRLVANGKTWADVVAYLESIKDESTGIPKWPTAVRDRQPLATAAFRRCPRCGKPLRLYPVNTDPSGCDRIGTTDEEDKKAREYRSMWLCGTSCSGRGCWYEEYSRLTVDQERLKWKKRREKILSKTP